MTTDGDGNGNDENGAGVYHDNQQWADVNINLDYADYIVCEKDETHQGMFTL